MDNMPRRKQKVSQDSDVKKVKSLKELSNIKFLNEDQKQAWSVLENNDVSFMMGVAGSGKTFLAIAYAIEQYVKKEKKKIILTRPIVEAGEKLGFLPGTFSDKVNPYMTPLYDCIDKLVGNGTDSVSIMEKAKLKGAIEVAPLAYLRGRTLENAICILDEAQNCTVNQLKMFLTRLGTNSKMIVTGDPKQSDLSPHLSGLKHVMNKCCHIKSIGVWEFDENAVVRHPVVAEIIKVL